METATFYQTIRKNYSFLFFYYITNSLLKLKEKTDTYRIILISSVNRIYLFENRRLNAVYSFNNLANRVCLFDCLDLFDAVIIVVNVSITFEFFLLFSNFSNCCL